MSAEDLQSELSLLQENYSLLEAQYNELLQKHEQAEAERDKMRTELEGCHLTMMAAAEEIGEHWDAHCDAEGYGPVNLERRLRECFAGRYEGYSIGEWDRLKKRAEQADAKLAAAEEWKKRVIDALVVGHIYCAAHDNDPKKALHDLISWEVQIALDPKVSSEAARLVTAARSEGMERAKLHDAVERACRDLPEGYEIQISLEKGAGTVYLIPQETDAAIGMDVDADNRLAAEVHEAINEAIRAEIAKGE